ncbi:aldose 1-epimerase [Mesorhizobium sp. ANAO-SY3R2]|uniref:aldose 1-epimerase n=1 Tax=Mesorhizobium sp. ANAO-SY3R2 TaxID=3166644 RepID=UPI00367083B8
MTRPLHLSCGELELDLAPHIGGSILSFRRAGLDLMRPTPDAALAMGLVRQTSCYPLVPYSNRIAHGRFAVGGETYQLTLNFGDHPHSIHGNGWQRAWNVRDAGESQAVLELDHRPFGFGPAGWDGWPYSFRATQSFTLSPDMLTVTLAIENTDARPMPAGLGWHPFFPARPGTKLRFGAGGVWINDATSLPVSLEPVPEKWDYSTARPLGEPALDNVFTQWDGNAEISFVEENVGLALSADPLFSHAVVYVPSGRGFFAFEPVSHMTDAVNRADIPGNGLQVLAPGERLSGTMRISVEPLP